MKDHFGALDGVRGLAALYVLIHHARLALTQSFMNGLSIHSDQYNLLDKGMFYFFSLFKFGQEAVIIFFVLSGFLIHLKQAKNPNYKDFNIAQYLKSRIIRIYPTLIFSIVFCVLLDCLLLLINKEYFNTILEKYNIIDFFTNILLIPETSAWGNNFSIWSLKHEWFFYLIYPLLFWLTTWKKIFPLIIVSILYISYLFEFKIPYVGNAASTLILWVLGAILAEIYIQKKNFILVFAILTILLIIGYPFIPYHENYPFKDLAFGLIICNIFYFIINNRLIFISKLLLKFSRLGAWSYSIYLLHLPLINTYQYLIRYFTKQDNLPYHLWHVLIATLIIPPIIYVLYYFTERFTIEYQASARKNFKVN